MASKSIAEAKRWMSNIRRRLQYPNRVPGSGLSTNRLEAYTDHFAGIFSSETRKSLPDSQRIAPIKDLGLKHRDLIEAVKCMPNDKASGYGGVTAEIQKQGGQALASVMNPSYRTARV